MSPYQKFIKHLSDAEVQQLIHGQAAIGCNDQHYLLVTTWTMPEALANDNNAAREQLQAQEYKLLERLYQSQPLCREEFDYQATQLLQQHGAGQFYHQGDCSWALMIDGSFLVAVPPDDVRSQYGYCCEGDHALVEDDAIKAVMRWLHDGTAYEDYRVKTHCRYICN